MLSIAWSLLLWTLIAQTTGNQNSASQNTGTQNTGNQNNSAALKLYQQASSLIAAGESALASPVLEQLCLEYPESILAPIAAVRVAQQYLNETQPQKACEILFKFAPAAFAEPTASQLTRIDADFTNRITVITKRALASLPENDTAFIEKATHQFAPESPLYCWGVAEQARRAFKQREYRKAIELLQKLGSQASPAEAQLRSVDLPLAILADKPTENDIAWINGLIETDTSLTQTQKFSLQLAMAESQRKSGQIAQALQLLEQLSQTLQTARDILAKEEDRDPSSTSSSPSTSTSTSSATSTSASTSIISPKQLKDWQATVELRRAEIHLARSEFSRAGELALSGIDRFADCSSIDQFRFVVAKCNIAEIDFDSARKQLGAVIEAAGGEPDASIASTTLARRVTTDQAWWMLGELDLMQRNYTAALDRYLVVCKGSHESPWKPRALLQAARCHEILGSPLDAYSAYQTIVTQFPQSDVASAARQRLSVLVVPQDNAATRSNPASPTQTIAR